MSSIVMMEEENSMELEQEWSEKSRVEFISRAVQTDSGTEEFIQISTSLQELLQRISSYQRYKRFQLDISNQVEFSFNDGTECTCARTDALHFRRSITDQTKLQDKKGPLGKPLLPLEQFQRSLLHEQASVWDKSANNAAVSLLHLPQRISNIEQYLGMNQGCAKPKDLLTRVSQLEIQLLAVEGRSYEYNHSKVGNKSVPLRN